MEAIFVEAPICYITEVCVTCKIRASKESNDKVSWASIQTSVQKGPENNVADALSRIGHHFNITDVSTTIPVWIQEVLNTYAVDSHAQQLLQELVVVSPNDEGIY
jgi:hypothetical protein